jgi:undecaprenyl-diphosphatase
VASASTRRQPAIAVRQRIVLLAISLAALLVFLWLGAEVHTSRTQAVDQHLRALVHSYASPGLTVTMRAVTHLGPVAPVIALSVEVVLALFSLRQRRPAGILAIVLAGALILNTGLKDWFQRARPDPFFGILPPHNYSFPSGHALFSFCFYGLLATMYVPRLPRRSQRVAGWAAAALITVAVGFSRVYLGVHYPTDVVGGWAAGLALVSFVLAVYPA